MQRRCLFGLGVLVLLVFFLSGCGAYTTGNIKLKQKNYEQAITYYLEELSENPDHFRARERLGFAYFKTGQLDKAIQELERALEQKPGDPSATYYLGLAWLNKGESGKAIDVWRTYRNAEEPLVEQQIKRQLTLLEIAQSIRLARQALAEEKKLQTLRPEPGTTAVFYFKDVSSDARYRYMQKALAMMITTDLSQIESLQVVERMRVQFLLAEMGLGETGLVDGKVVQQCHPGGE